MGLMSGVAKVLGVGGDGGASDFQKQALAELDKIAFPSVEQMRIYLAKLVQQGQITPEQANTFQQQKTAYNDMQIDRTGRDAQIEALTQLQDKANAGGMDAIDKARVLDIENQLATANRGSTDAIVQNAAERGVSGSGLEYATRLNAGQSNATAAATKGAQVAADASARALEALMAAGNMGTTVYGQDAELAAKKAEAQDVINRFNTSNAQAVEGTNVAARNDAQEKNLSEKQRISDANVGNVNSAEVYNKGLYQQDFNNRMSKAAAKAGQYNKLAETALSGAERQDQFTGELIGAGGQILAGSKKKWRGGKVGCSTGGKVPGNAPRAGDHPANDVVDVSLSPDEIVVPRSKSHSPAKAAAFAAKATGAHPEDIESVLAALSSLRSKVKKKAA